MAREIELYIGTLAEAERSRIAEIYAAARQLVPAAEEGISYGMPCLLYQGKGLIAVMSTKKHIGIYPFGAIAELADSAAGAGLQTTKGSIHLREGQRIPSDLLEQLLLRRVRRIQNG